MNSTASLTKWQRFRNSFSQNARLCRIVFRRGIFWTGHLLRGSRNNLQFALRLQYLWLTSNIWFLRFYRSFVKYPGWTIATVSGYVGILLLIIIQIEVFFSKSSADAEPLRNPFLEITNMSGEKGVVQNAESEVLHDDFANARPAQKETNAQPVLDIAVVLFRPQSIPESPEQFLVTSVRDRSPLNQIPIRTGKSLWKAFHPNQNRIAIQPLKYLSQEFPNDPPSAESFVEPFPTKPAHNEIPYPTSEIPSSYFSTTVTTAEIPTAEKISEQTIIAETPKLNLVVTISEHTQIGRPERIQFQMVNTGRVSATNVILGIEIPEEFAYRKGLSLEYKVGTIPPGETRIARLTPKAVTTGVAVFEIEVTADAGFSQILKQPVEVVAAD